MRVFGLESTNDVQAFREAIAQRSEMPRATIALRMNGLRADQRTQAERQINELLRSTGWLEAAGGALVIAAVVLIGLSWAGHGRGLGSSAWWATELSMALLGSLVGRWLGLRMAKHRLLVACKQLEEHLSPSSA